ncbi:glycosyl hydrolase [Sphaerisporangium melleum]|uniref:Glycosyl hydrolase n=1 Tax=Sphaerisporangium melleum TaxID=321316 RepID=A0A917RFG3_9ACTN|nr:ThuA domain-containing protein [Sphaerisporangium melleum]GGL04783.1 glycosyl hydrolase [Sphaerisporangium melleum]GII74080.1 glycosyl hydrolase [Sphaerisporangium melleum]
MRRPRLLHILTAVLLLLPFGGVPAANAAAPLFKVLLFSKTASGAYRHDSISAGIAMFQQLAADNNFQLDRSEDSSVFNTTTLNTYDAVIMLQTSGMVWDNDAQRQAAQAYVRSGHGIVAIHNATDMNIESQFPWWDQTVLGGAHMTQHSNIVQGTAKVADKVHPSTVGLPDRWTRTEEWYNFDKNMRGSVHVLVTADETTYDAGGNKMGADHPISWCHNPEGGRVWATAMGHNASSYSEASFKQHLLGGVKWAAGAEPGDCGGTVTSRYQKVTLDGAPDQPMELDIAPDGTVYYISRSGKVNMITPGGAPRVIGTLSVYDGGEDGGIGLALDPNFATNRWIYLNYSPLNGGEVNRVSRFTVNGTTLDLSSEKKIIEVPAYRNVDEPGHTGGYLAFGPNGNLYIAPGDDTNPNGSSGYAPIDERSGREHYDAQRSAANTNDLRGKILRIHPESDGTYTIPSGNLFAPGTAKTRPEIYAMGFRNAFRFSVDKKTGWISAGDYGPDAGSANSNRGPEGTVEWNLIKEPGNYGWPYCVGNNIPFNDFNFATNTSGAKFNCSAPVNNSPNNTGLTNLPAAKSATIWYNYHASAEFPEINCCGGAAPMGGPFYNYDPSVNSDRKFPEYFDKTPFLYEWSRNFFKEVRLDSSGNVLKISPFVPQLAPHAPIDMKFGPDGAMYYADWGNGFGHNNTDDGIYRVDYIGGSGGNRSPVAKASATPDSGSAPLTVAFSSAGSSDPDGDAITYAWDFGDGGTSTSANPSHTYAANGNYTARLTVKDTGGKTGTITLTIGVGNTRPQVTFSAPPDGGFINFGDTVNYNVTVTDPEDGTVDCSKVTVIPALGHDQHSHDTGQVTGCSGTITTTASGHDEASNVYYVLLAEYTDKGGLKGSTGITLQPKHKQAEFFTGSSGVQVVDQSAAEGGRRVGDISGGDWISFTPMNLTGITSVSFRVAAPSNTGGSIELRADSPTGALIASSSVPSTGGWNNYQSTTAATVTNPGGTRNVYMVFRAPTANSFDVDSITFNGNGVGTGTGTPQTRTYTMTAVNSGKAADVRGASTADGAAVIQWTPSTGTNQQWKATDAGNGTVTLTAVHSNKCMDVTNSSTSDGALIRQMTCNGANNQKWRLESVSSGVYRIVSVQSSKCLDVPGASTANDVQLNQWTCNNGTNQQWRLTQVG